MSRSLIVRTIAAAEVRSALAGRLVQGFGLLFAALALVISVAGLGASGQLLVQGFTRTAISLLMLALYLLPLLGLVTGANAFGAEHGGMELLLAQPVSRTDVFMGRALGLASVLVGVGVVGFGLAGLVVGVAAGLDGVVSYVLVAAGSMAAGLAGLALGILVGVLARRRSAAVAMSLGAWVCLVVLYDFLAIAVLQFVGTGYPGPLLVALLALNPIDGLRALALVRLGADVLLGPTGVAMQRLLGGAGTALVLVSLVLSAVIPLAVGRAVYLRRDF
jgi:Cu-processing system permease protein